MNIQFHGTSQQGKGISIPPPPPFLVISRAGAGVWTDEIPLEWNNTNGGACGTNQIDVSSNTAWICYLGDGGTSRWSRTPISGSGNVIETVTLTYNPTAPAQVESDILYFSIDASVYAQVINTAGSGCA